MAVCRPGKRVDVQFRGLDAHGVEIKITARNLPHWRQTGATYFVTFRLADAVPATLLRQWKEELKTWLKFHPEPWDVRTEHEYQRRFQESREEWLDRGHGSCLFREESPAEIVAGALKHFQGTRGYLLDAFVVMPNHVHALLLNLLTVIHIRDLAFLENLHRERDKAQKRDAGNSLAGRKL